MAIRDDETLRKVTNLSEKLKEGNFDEIKNDLSSRLFGTLDSNSSITLDSEIFVSIKDLENATNLTRFIDNTRNNINNTPIQIPYTTGNFNINSTNGRPTGTSITDTQNKINETNRAKTALDNLPSHISTLRTRLEQNYQTLSEIKNDQENYETTYGGTYRSITNIDSNLNNTTNISSRLSTLDSLLQSIAQIESRSRGGTMPASWTNIQTSINHNITGLHTALRTHGTTTTIPDYNSIGDHASIKLVVENIQEDIRRETNDLNAERRLLQEIMTKKNRLASRKITVSPNFNPFNSDDTIVDKNSLTTSHESETALTNTNTNLNNLEILEGQINTINSRYQENLEKLNKLKRLQELDQKLNRIRPGEMRRRNDEFQRATIIGTALKLDDPNYNPELPNISSSIGGTITTINLRNEFLSGTTPTNTVDSYTLCSNDGTELRKDGGKFIIKLSDGKEVKIGGISFTTAGILTFSNLSISPIENISFPISLDLNAKINVHDNVSGININHHKPLHLEIRQPTLNTTDRENAYDAIIPPIPERIQAEYTNKYKEDIENAQILKILKENGNKDEVEKTIQDPTRKKILLERYRNLLNRLYPVSVLVLTDLQDGFKQHTINDNSIPPQYLLNATTFTDYLRNNIPDKLRKYAESRIYDILNTRSRTNILQEFISFQTDTANHNVDNNDNLSAIASIPTSAEGPQGHPNSLWQRLIKKRSNRNNYTRFFVGKSCTIKDQEVQTEDGKVKYSIDIKTEDINQITAKISIEGEGEKELQASNHDELIRQILGLADLNDDKELNNKVRCHIAISALKAFISTSPFSLNREITPTEFIDSQGNRIRCDRIETKVESDGNIIILGAIVDPTLRKRRSVEIFNEKNFKNLYNQAALEAGIRNISNQINTILNATAKEYNDATNRIITNKGLMRYDTKQIIKGGPIKKLRGRMLHGKTNYNFDFTTSVNDEGRSVDITFEKGKYIISGEFDGQHFEYKSKDLGSILRKKINRKNVFVGIELSMIETINEEFVKKLRTNNLIKTENFAIADTNSNKTGKIYIFDSLGNLSYLQIEDRSLNPLRNKKSGCIKHENLPPARIKCTAKERKEFFQNPLLGGRLQKEMRKKLSLF